MRAELPLVADSDPTATSVFSPGEDAIVTFKFADGSEHKRPNVQYGIKQDCDFGLDSEIHPILWIQAGYHDDDNPKVITIQLDAEVFAELYTVVGDTAEEFAEFSFEAATDSEVSPQSDDSLTILGSLPLSAGNTTGNTSYRHGLAGLPQLSKPDALKQQLGDCIDAGSPPSSHRDG